MGTCKTCKFWDQERAIDKRFGECKNNDTSSWVRGQSFDPPHWFGCINHSDALPVIVIGEIRGESDALQSNQ